MNPFAKVWFWLLILSIIGFILSFIFFERIGQTNTDSSSTPAWIWIVFIISLILFFAAFILYAIDVAAYHRRMEIAEACGEVPHHHLKRKIECPKKECVEKKVVECVKRDPCDNVEKRVLVSTDETRVQVSGAAGQRYEHEVGDPGYTTPTRVVTVVPGPAAGLPAGTVPQTGGLNIAGANITTNDIGLPKVVTVSSAPEEAFSAAGLRPLSSLAPPSVTVV